MELVVNRQRLVEVLAYDNMINAFIARLINASNLNDVQLLEHYQKEIRTASASKSAILSDIYNGEFLIDGVLVQ